MIAELAAPDADLDMYGPVTSAATPASIEPSYAPDDSSSPPAAAVLSALSVMTARAPLPVLPAKVAEERLRFRPADSPDDDPPTNLGIATVWTPNALNQYHTINSGTPVSPVHDDDGNLMADMGENLRGVALKYTWDAENRIIAVHRASDNALVAKYEYDFQSRRIRKEVTSAAPQGAEAITFIYHGWNPIAEYTDLNSVPTLHKAYSWGLDLSRSMQGAGGVGGLLAITDHRTATAGHYYPAFDGNGNLMQLYKDVGGTDLVQRVARFDYDPFGRIVREDGAYAAHLRIRFSTKYQDQETGFLYYGYRYLDPHTGRWPSRDPIGERGGANLYGFIYNNAIKSYDILGLCRDGECKIHISGWKDVSLQLAITLGSNNVISIDSPELLGMLDPDLNLGDLEFRDIAGGLKGMLLRKMLAKVMLDAVAQSVVKGVGKAKLPSQKALLTTYTSMTLSVRYDAMYNICRCKEGKWGKWENWWLMSKLDNQRFEVSKVNADNAQEGNQIADMTLDGLRKSLGGLVENATLDGLVAHTKSEIKIKEGCK